MAALENIVAKFGGSSVATAEGLSRCVDIILGEYDGRLRKYVVFSAPGKRHRDDIKVTDLLIALGRHRLGEPGGYNAFGEIVSRFGELIGNLQKGDETLQDLISEEHVAAELRKCYDSSTQNPAEYKDQLNAFGEYVMAQIAARILETRRQRVKLFLPKEIGFHVTDTFGDARVLPESYENIAGAIKGFDGIAVFPGYYGVTKDGKIVTFQRGGSDTVGSILANSASAGLYENWTDTNGIGVLSPQVNGNGEPFEIRRIDVMIYEEAVLLTNAGFTVLHPDSIKPVMAKSIPIRVRNSMNPQHPGTLIVSEAAPSSLVTGIAYRGGFVSVSCRYPFDIELQSDIITGIRAELSRKGVRPFRITAQNGESLLYDEQKLDPLVLNDAKRRVIDGLKAARPDLSTDLGGIQVSIEHRISLVSVVGRGMKYDRQALNARLSEALQGSGVEATLVADEPLCRAYLIRENPLAKEPANAVKAAVAMYKQFAA